MNAMMRMICCAALICFAVACKPQATTDAPATDGGKKKAAVTKPTEITICTACGEIKGNKKCCAKDAEKCAKCGLNKGSIGCCKIPKCGGCGTCDDAAKKTDAPKDAPKDVPKKAGSSCCPSK